MHKELLLVSKLLGNDKEWIQFSRGRTKENVSNWGWTFLDIHTHMLLRWLSEHSGAAKKTTVPDGAGRSNQMLRPHTVLAQKQLSWWQVTTSTGEHSQSACSGSVQTVRAVDPECSNRKVWAFLGVFLAWVSHCWSSLGPLERCSHLNRITLSGRRLLWGQTEHMLIGWGAGNGY